VALPVPVLVAAMGLTGLRFGTIELTRDMQMPNRS
jgi:hypothetical protein